MEYKVLPFHPTITTKGAADQAAKELQELIANNTADGWKFISLESMSTTMKQVGCAAGFAKPELKIIQLVIFGK